MSKEEILDLFKELIKRNSYQWFIDRAFKRLY